MGNYPSLTIVDDKANIKGNFIFNAVLQIQQEWYINKMSTLKNVDVNIDLLFGSILVDPAMQSSYSKVIIFMTEVNLSTFGLSDYLVYTFDSYIMDCLHIQIQSSSKVGLILINSNNSPIYANFDFSTKTVTAKSMSIFVNMDFTFTSGYFLQDYGPIVAGFTKNYG